MATTGGMVLGKQELATFLGISFPSIGHWVARGCPYVTKGGLGKKWEFNTAEVVAWREAQAADKAQGDVSSTDIDEARRRKMAAEAAMTELDLQVRRGELVEIETVAEAVGEDYANVRAKLLSMPSKLAPQLAVSDDPLACLALLETGIHEALEELTKDDNYASEEEPAAKPAKAKKGKSKTAAKADSQPVV